MAFLEEIAGIPTESIAYVDETGIDTFLYREYGYAKRGETLLAAVSGKKYRRTSSIVAAQIGKKIYAPLQYDGTMDSLLFELWFQRYLLPALPPASVIVMDNAAFHRKSMLALLAQNTGHRLFFSLPTHLI